MVRLRLRRARHLAGAFVALLGCTAGLATIAPAATAAPSPQASIDRQSADLVARFLAANGLTGAQVAVLRDGQQVQSAAYGTRTDGSALTNATRFDIASVTKTFTAALVWRAVDQGLIDPDAPVPPLAAVPGFAAYGAQITPRQLLTHQSGLMPYRDTPGYLANPNAISTPQAALAAVVAAPLQFAPGTNTGYSTSNYLVLGFLLEQVTGRSYDDLLRNDLLVPLGLGAITHLAPQPASPNFSTAGIMATASELATWLDGLVLHNAAGLSAGSLAALVDTGSDSGFGAGTWGYCPCRGTEDGTIARVSVGHSGSQTIAETFPADGVTIVVQTSDQFWVPEARVHAVMQLVQDLHAIVVANGKTPGGGTVRVHVGPPNTVAVGNLTVAEAETAGFATVYGCANGRPATSNINFVPGRTVANLTIAATDANGDLCIFTNATTHLIYDHTTTTTTLTPDAATRLLDTRATTKATPATTTRIHIGPAATVAIGNLTITDPDTPGYATIYGCANGRPPTSNINFAPGQTVANLTIAATDANGDLCIFTNATTHLIYDHTTTTTTLTPDAATRLLDTRATTKATPATTTRIHIGPAATVAIGNLTITDPDTPGYATIYGCANGRPPTSNINFAPGQTVANLTIAATDANGDLCIFTNATTHLIYDHTTTTTTLTPDAATRLLDTRV